MGTLRDDLLDTTMVRMPDGSYLPQSQVRGMSASQIADLYKSSGGFGSTLDSGTGIQSAQEMFNQTYAEAMANEYLANILEGQGVPDVVPFSTEDALRSVQIADGISQNEIDYVVELLDQNLVTIDDVAAQTGIPAAEIQAVYNQVKGQPVVDPLDVLNDPTNVTAGLINLTIGSNQMLDPATLTAAQAAAQAAAQSPAVSPEVSQAAEAAGGGQTEEFVDLGADTTANDLLTGGLGDADTGGVADVNETWTYDKATDSFISNTRGDVFPNRGNATLKDGGIYAVTPVIGTDGVTAENVVDTETNESVGILNVDITTGLPSIIKTVDAGSSVSETDTFGTAQDTLNTGQTLGVGGGNLGGATTGDTGFETARDTNNTGKTLTVGDATTTTVTDKTKDTNDDGVNNTGTSTDTNTKTTTGTSTTGTSTTGTSTTGTGTTGTGTTGTGTTGTGTTGTGTTGTGTSNGKNIGMISAIVNNTPITDLILFEPKFTKLENVQQGMFEQFLRAAGGRR